MVQLINVFNKICCVLMTLLLLFNGGINRVFSGDVAAWQSETGVVGLEALLRAQGVTNDGESWYFSGKNALQKVDIQTNQTVAVNVSAIPRELSERFGSKHIGGIGYYNGYIYAGVEDSKVWEHPLVVLFNADTLAYSGIYFEMSTELFQRGIPWVTVDAQNGVVYAGDSRNKNEVYRFDAEDLSYLDTLTFQNEVSSIQGAEWQNGILYCGTNDDTRAVYAVNTQSGGVTKLFDRILSNSELIDNFGGEGEDLTVLKMDDGTFIHTLQIGALFTDATLRHYTVNEELLPKQSDTAVCQNGKFKGAYEEETGILSFKGIPYAKAPVGNLRWKAPLPPEHSTQTFDATQYGKSSIQYYWHSEDITTEVGEDCLSLNIWTDSLETDNKAVMVFFHGGAFAWGGSSEPLYNGQYIVNEHKDVIVVTCNYRVGVMGFVNFNGMKGSEAFPDTKNLGLLDCMQALSWIHENIRSFGGNPDNVTVFGESAGGTICASLLLTDIAGELFQRAIVQSGPIGLTMSKAQSENRHYNADMLAAYADAESMDDLMSLTEEELIAANEYEWDEDGTTLNDCYDIIVRDEKPIEGDPYELYRTGNAKNVDLMIGTNLDEVNYWINEMGEVPLSQLSEEEIEENVYLFNNYFVEPYYEKAVQTATPTEREAIESYLALYADMGEEAAKARLASDLSFRASSIKTAEEHSKSDGTGKTYMYLFEKENTDFDVMKACHASELAYVFHNLQNTEFSGTVDKELADNMCEAWVNFAKTGNPSTAQTPWAEYDEENRTTMIMKNDNTMACENDPYSEERVLLSELVKYYLTPSGA